MWIYFEYLWVENTSIRYKYSPSYRLRPHKRRKYVGIISLKFFLSWIVQDTSILIRIEDHIGMEIWWFWFLLVVLNKNQKTVRITSPCDSNHTAWFIQLCCNRIKVFDVEVGGSDGDDCSLLKRILFSGSTNPMTNSLSEDDAAIL